MENKKQLSLEELIYEMNESGIICADWSYRMPDGDDLQAKDAIKALNYFQVAEYLEKYQESLGDGND